MPLLAWLGNILFTFALTSLNIFARAATINIAIAAALTVALGAALTTLLSVVSDGVGSIMSSASTIPAAPYFLPGNIPECIGVYMSISIAGVIYRMTLNWLENRAMIFKA